MLSLDLAFTPGSKEVVKVAAEVKEGEVLVLSAPSGAGKTTLLRILARLQPALSGDVCLHDANWKTMPATQWRVLVHYLAQKPSLFEGTVAENLARPFTTKMLNKKTFLPGKAKTLLADLRLPVEIWDQDARTLSGGEAARLAFVRALLIDPEIMLLDEPTAALDEESRKAFYGVLQFWLQEPGHAAVLVSHAQDYGVLDNIRILKI